LEIGISKIKAKVAHTLEMFVFGLITEQLLRSSNLGLHRSTPISTLDSFRISNCNIVITQS